MHFFRMRNSNDQSSLIMNGVYSQVCIAEINTCVTSAILFTTFILPDKVKMQYLHFRFYANFFLLPWKIPEEICRQSVLFNILRYYILFQTYQPFYHGSGLTWNWTLIGSIYCIWYLHIPDVSEKVRCSRLSIFYFITSFTSHILDWNFTHI